MSGNTMVFGSAARRSEKWRVYLIRTANSTYELEVESEQQGSKRRCAVLTCVAPAERAGENFEDSAPQLDAKSLYEFSPMEWMGRRLAVGTARTSEIQSVDFITANDTPTSRARIQKQLKVREALPPLGEAPKQAAPAQEERHQWAPFPEGQVEMAEVAASLLKAVCHRNGVLPAVRQDANLDQRLKLAFAECRLMLEALLRR